MAREITISFALNAALSGGFKGAFQSATSCARNVATAIRDMERSPVGHLGAAMIQQREKIQGLAGSLREAQATLVTLQGQAQRAGGATGMLARQIDMAQSRVTNLNGAMQRQLGIWRNTTAQAATVGGSVHNLCQEYERLSQRMERARRVQTAFNANRAQADALRNQRADLNSRLTGAVATAATVAAPIALSIGFEDQMAKVGAVSKASKEDLAALTAQARQLGRDTNFSASQAAEGMQYLAMAGFKTNQVMAAMPGMLDLAAASGSDLGQTANIASNILSAFGLKAEEMGHVADVLTAGFTSSNTTLESLGETMKYVGPVAKDAGASIEDAVAMAGMLGNVGISGSQAGTASKAIFARLAAPPSEAAKALNALNIKTKDAQGNLRAVPDILEEITLKTASMGTADRTDVFSKVFGLEPMAGASALAKEAARTVDENGQQIVDSMGRPTTALLKFTDELKHASDDLDGLGGASKRVATQMNATTGGELRRLRSAWEDTGISIGNLFLPAIQMASGALSTIANVISAAVNRFPLLSRVIALTVGGVLAFTAASVGVGLVMNFVRSGLNGLRGGLLRVATAHVAATTYTTASTVATRGFGIASRIAGAGAKFFSGGLRSILIASGVGAILVGLGFAINLLIDNWDAVVTAMTAAWGWVTDTWSRLGVFFTQLGKNLGEVFSGWGDTLTGWLGPVWTAITSVWDGIKSYYSMLFGGVTTIVVTAWNFISGLITRPVETIKGAWSGITGFFTSLWQGIVSGASFIGNAITSVFSWAKEGIIGVWTGITGFFSGIWGWISDSASGLWDSVISVASWAFDSVAGIWNVAVTFFTGIASGITSCFTWASDSVTGIWQGVVGFFGAVGQGISDSFSWVWQGIVGWATWAWEEISAIWTGVSNFFSGIVDGIFGVFTGLFNWLKEKFAWVFSTIDSISSVIGSITGAVNSAIDYAFGDGDDKGSAAPNANGVKAGVATNETPKNAAQNANKASQKPMVPPPSAAPNANKAVNTPITQPKYQPVSAADYHAAFEGNKGGSKAKASGGKKSSGGGGGGGRSRAGGSAGAGGGSGVGTGSGKSSDSGPVTIVTLDSGNEIKTQYFPASRNAAPNATRVMNEDKSGKDIISGALSTFKSSGLGGLIGQGVQAGLGLAKSTFGFGQSSQQSAVQTATQGVKTTAISGSPVEMSAVRSAQALSSQPVLPQTPPKIAKMQAQKAKEKGQDQQSISIDLTQNFDLITQDAAAARKVLEAIKPDMEALIRRALEKIKSDKRRTAYAQ